MPFIYLYGGGQRKPSPRLNLINSERRQKMVSVNTNIASVDARNSLMGNNVTMDKAFERLSSGKRINSSSDDAAGLQIANSLTSQINGLKMATKNAGDGISLVNTVDGALSEATDILQRMRELAVQSSSDTNSGQDRVFIQEEINALNTELNRISSTTQFNGVNVLNGTFGDISLQIGYDPSQTVNMSVNSSDAATLGAYQKTSTVETGSNYGTYALATAGLTTTIADAADYTISGFFGTDTAYISAEAGARDVAAAFNLISGNTGVTATAETRARLTVSAAETFSFDLYGKSSTASKVVAVISDTSDLTNLKDAINAVSGSTGITATLTSDKAGVNVINPEGYTIYFADATAVGGADANLNVATLVYSAAGVATVAGTKNLDGDATGSDSTFVLGQVTLSSDKAFSFSSGNAANHFATDTSAQTSTLSQLGDINLKNVHGAQKALAIIDRAINMIDVTRASMGALNNRLESTINNLNNIQVKSEAALSRIMDADYAEETASLSKSQVLTQAATAMLAQANQAPQGVLRLLQAG